MRAFTEIESLRHVSKTVANYCERKGKPRPTITYIGTVKLHGTNAGVRVTDKRVQAQGRTRILDIGSDNYGFAAFCAGKTELFTELTKKVLNKTKLKNLDEVTFYGEWIGQGIQAGVAVSKLPKHLVIFAAWVSRDTYITINDITKNLDDEFFKQLNDAGIFFINQVPTYACTIDFSNIEDALESLEKDTLDVETICPWGKFRGVEGIGEGIVWRPSGKLHADLSGDSELWFKTKGLEHKRRGASGSKIEVAPEKVATIKEFVELVLPAWRLEQGVSQLKQNGLDIIPENTGEYLKWISQDIIKEESDRLAANNLCWKDVVSAVSKVARQYYLTEADKNAFAKEPA